MRATCDQVDQRMKAATSPATGILVLVTLALLIFAQLAPLHAQPAAPNYVLSLGGTNGFLELPSGAFNDLEEVTIEGWVKWMDDLDNRRFFDFGKASRAIRLRCFCASTRPRCWTNSRADWPWRRCARSEERRVGKECRL